MERELKTDEVPLIPPGSGMLPEDVLSYYQLVQNIKTRRPSKPVASNKLFGKRSFTRVERHGGGTLDPVSLDRDRLPRPQMNKK